MALIINELHIFYHPGDTPEIQKRMKADFIKQGYGEISEITDGTRRVVATIFQARPQIVVPAAKQKKDLYKFNPTGGKG